ncbi:winged helix-turn-helix domain-containing tetratricopeptide repeat protein [Roseovarius sp. 2305UL8-3]|uniref:winged helix-turn-helix domain-containing tetratricopeptide repeat protein n=1 Tax=Roseovarius conchicola TaxID=3121636 RepID=UPI003528DF95
MKLTNPVTLGEFSFSLQTRELTDQSGHVVHLRSQSSDVLAYLVTRIGETVSKDIIIENVWAKSFVTDDSLTQCIADIRRALGDSEYKIVQTRPKKGYRLNATPVQQESAPQPDIGATRVRPWSRIGLIGILVSVAIGLGIFWAATNDGGPGDQTPASLPLPSKPSIAVLAFEDLSVGDEEGYLSDAIAEGVIANLSRFPELFVIARNSSFSFRGAPTKVADISKALGVRYLLEGSQQKSGDRLRVTIQLVDAVEGNQLWSQVYNSDLNDVFAVQDDIVRRVVATVAQKVINSEGQDAIHSDEAKLTALLLNLKARQHLFDFTPEGNEKARLANLAAVEADPTQPFGYVGLTFVHINKYRWGWTDQEPQAELEAAREFARKAVETGPDYYDSHSAMAYFHIQEGRLDKAIARYEQALELNPGDTGAMASLAEALTYGGQAEEAEELMLKVVRLDPLHQDWIKWNLAWVQWHTRHCEDGLRTMNAMSEIPPMAYRVLAILQVCLDNTDDAKAAVERLLEFDPEYSIVDVRHNYDGKYTNSSDLERVLNDLRVAGLPE